MTTKETSSQLQLFNEQTLDSNNSVQTSFVVNCVCYGENSVQFATYGEGGGKALTEINLYPLKFY